MTAPGPATDPRRQPSFELTAALLIGAVAVLAALLAVVEVDTGQRCTRAQIEASRLTADLSAGLQVSDLVNQAMGSQQQAAVALSFEGASRGLAALERDDQIAVLVSSAQLQASEALTAALSDTAATVAGPPLDAYTTRLVNTTLDDLTAEVTEQNHQVDLADQLDARNTRATLGLSFLALAGVLTGLGAVLREGRAGWFALVAAGAMSTTAGVMAILAVI